MHALARRWWYGASIASAARCATSSRRLPRSKARDRLRSLTESNETTTPGGRLVFHVFAALAEFERDLIRERTQAGLSAARTRGRRGGRPTVMSAEKLAVARSMHTTRESTRRRRSPRCSGEPGDALPPSGRGAPCRGVEVAGG